MRRRRDRGIVLLLALLLLVLLTLVIGQMALTSRHNRSVADNAMGALQGEYAVRAGHAQAMLRLEFDAEKSAATDHLHEAWADPFTFALGDASVRVSIQDSERRFNLNALVNEEGEEVPAVSERLQRLVSLLGHEPVETTRRIVDYLDADTKGDYEAGARNARMTTLDELTRIEGLKREAIFGDADRKGLLGLVTLWPHGKKPATKLAINPNTAPAELLQCLDEGLTAGLAQAIVTWRDGRTEDGSWRSFAKADDLTKVTGISPELAGKLGPHLVFAASVFEVRVASIQQAVERKHLTVVARSTTPPPAGGTVAPAPKHKLVTSLRENDFLSLPPPEGVEAGN